MHGLIEYEPNNIGTKTKKHDQNEKKVYITKTIWKKKIKRTKRKKVDILYRPKTYLSFFIWNKTKH